MKTITNIGSLEKEEWTPDEVPLFKYNAGAEFRVPTTMEELIEAYNKQKT